ncbi:hypothetical protein [Mycolicibacter kumamotonensis]|uniref:Exo-alpha-sialidase n=1 Tax=Mycolicibacter kumamotonensis TaxID=354243 RepID=A0A1B8SL69_9MYCO|nr:hypothetical protein [Mycolicibacter kumamotonensis]OBY33485.1 hypothetical protein ACT18_00620 [Mycolicibacter kumamotonensis]
MGTVRTPRPAEALDADGISVITTNRSTDDLSAGSIYDLDNFAAAQPVHFHPTRPGVFVMLFSRRWHDATLSASDVGSYSTYTEDATPGWTQIDSAGYSTMIGQSYAIPHASGTLVAACSRDTTYLYALSATGDTGLIQHLRYDPQRVQMLSAQAEPMQPVTSSTGESVSFHRGVYLTNDSIVVIGSGADTNQLYLRKKHWSRIGVNRTASDTPGQITDPTWRYGVGESAWSADPGEMAPLDITTHGPVSTATYRDSLMISTVEIDADTGAASARVWARRPGKTPWTKQADSVPLGSTADGSYAGGTLEFQPNLRCTDTTIAIPYTTTVKSVGTSSKLTVAWGTWLVLI